MANEQFMKHCTTCGKPTLHIRHVTNHILHLLLALTTFGIWLIVWALLSIGNARTARCTLCGQSEHPARDPMKPYDDGWNE